MGRGGGSSGGGRSFSSGGGRSFGGTSSSSSRGGSSSSSRSRGGSSFSSSRSSYRPGTTVVRNNYYGGGYRRGSGISAVFAIMIVAMVIIFVAFLSVGLSGNNVKINGARKSTIERTAIQPAAAFDRDCIDDQVGWISNSSTLLRGMEEFYKMTGVQPAICITSSINGSVSPDNDTVEAFATAEYDMLIGHEKGVLLLFFEPYPSDWDAWYMAGTAAQTVMDSEACDILMDFVEAYYSSDMTEDDYFAAVFRETGSRIMTVTPTFVSKIPVIVCGVIVIAFIVALVVALKLKYKRDRERAAETERILNTHVDRL